MTPTTPPKPFTARVLHALVHLTWLCALSGCTAEPEDLSDRVSIVRAWGVELAIDDAPASEDRFDLRPISIPDHASIVMLGEQTHGDGSSFLLKTELIRHLHQQLGFRVLVFESSLYDCSRADLQLEDGDDAHAAFQSCLFDVWADSRQLQPLIHYVDAHRGDLSIAGMDLQFSGNASWTHRMSGLVSHIRDVLGDTDSAPFESTFDLLRDSTLVRHLPDSTRREQITASIRALGRAVSARSDSTVQQLVTARTLGQLPLLYTFAWLIRSHRLNARTANVRDSLMAANLIWLAEHVFPEEKLIVWGANSHLSHYREGLTHGDAMIPMGSRVRSALGDRVFTILFTSFTGQTGRRDGTVLPVPRASRRGFEYAAHVSGASVAWFDFSRLQAGSLYHAPFKARFLGYADKEALWHRMANGFIYIDAMQPNTRAEPDLSPAGDD